MSRSTNHLPTRIWSVTASKTQQAELCSIVDTSSHVPNRVFHLEVTVTTGKSLPKKPAANHGNF